MKTLKSLVVGLLFIASTQAQVSVDVNVSKPPVWAPAKAVATQYYYLPDVDMYYDVPAKSFLHQKNGKWIRTKQLPAQHRGYNLKNGKIVYLTDYKGNAPYTFHKKHKAKYPGHKRHAGPKHAKHDEGKHKGHDNHKKHDHKGHGKHDK